MGHLFPSVGNPALTIMLTLPEPARWRLQQVDPPSQTGSEQLLGMEKVQDQFCQ